MFLSVAEIADCDLFLSVAEVADCDLCFCLWLKLLTVASVFVCG